MKGLVQLYIDIKLIYNESMSIKQDLNGVFNRQVFNIHEGKLEET